MTLPSCVYQPFFFLFPSLEFFVMVLYHVYTKWRKVDFYDNDQQRHIVHGIAPCISWTKCRPHRSTVIVVALLQTWLAIYHFNTEVLIVDSILQCHYPFWPWAFCLKYPMHRVLLRVMHNMVRTWPKPERAWAHHETTGYITTLWHKWRSTPAYLRTALYSFAMP